MSQMEMLSRMVVEAMTQRLLDAAWAAWGADCEDDNARMDLFNVLTRHMTDLTSLPTEVDLAFRWARQRDAQDAEAHRDRVV